MSPKAGLIQTLILMALILVLCYKYIDIRTRNTHFECPACGAAFKLSKINFAFALKKNSYERMVTCLVCGYKGWMQIINDD
jgi:transcription elongation factor Elf1